MKHKHISLSYIRCKLENQASAVFKSSLVRMTAEFCKNQVDKQNKISIIRNWTRHGLVKVLAESLNEEFYHEPGMQRRLEALMNALECASYNIPRPTALYEEIIK